MQSVDLQTYPTDAPSYVDRTGVVHTGKRLSVIEEYDLERRYGLFLGQVLAGQLEDGKKFEAGVRPIITDMGYDADALLREDAEAFWDVLNGFFKPRTKRGEQKATATAPAAAATSP